MSFSAHKRRGTGLKNFKNIIIFEDRVGYEKLFIFNFLLVIIIIIKIIKIINIILNINN